MENSSVQSESAQTVHELFQRSLNTEDGIQLAQLARRWTRVSKEQSVAPSFKLAVLSEGSAETFLPQLRVISAARGHDFIFKSGTFGGISQDILDDSSELYQFKPDITLIHPLPCHLLPPPLTSTEEQISKAAESHVERLLSLCGRLHDRSGSEIILANFEQPWSEPFAGLPAHTVSLTIFVQLVNRQLANKAPPFVHVLDVHSLVNWFGRDRWHDPRLWHHAKQPMSHDGIVLFAKKFAGIIAGIRGTSSKCLVLDLDNTLWGGVIGEDGLEGIRLGEGSAEGEAYKAFQCYVKGLKDRGILLAVCSKNDPLNARKPFEQHPEMVLKLNDICCFVANWESKADNCLQIAKQLNILPDALVFVDDEKAEREIVRQFAPQVRVLDMPEDASLFPRTIEKTFLFETRQLTPEDLERTAYYQVENDRKSLEASVTDLDAFLKSLNMVADIAPYLSNDVSRITQLFNKSNQFNLCTCRYSEEEIKKLVNEKEILSVQIRINDRFGDYGLISMAHARTVNPKVIRLENWIMSCRVLKRGVEQLMCNLLIEGAMKRGFTIFEFDYYPTSKNSLVKDLYQRLGFQKIMDLDNKGERWNLPIKEYKSFSTYIEKKSSL